jgi:hypothetical protein
MMVEATYRVPRRIYGPADQYGHRQLLHAEGSFISYEEAVAAGLTEPGALPAEAVPFVIPHNVYEDGPTGRVLRAREGTVTTLAEARRLGLVQDSDERPEDGAGASEGGDDGDGETEPEESSLPGPRSRPRTAKRPAPSPPEI